MSWPAGPSRVLIAKALWSANGGLEQSLGDGFEVLTSCGDSEDILEALASVEPDVVVLEMDGRDHQALALLRQIRAMRAARRVVLVATEPSDDVVLEALRLEVGGLVVNPASADEVADCVRRVCAGDLCLDQRALRRAIAGLGGQVSATDRQSATVLTPEDLAIVRRVGHGLTSTASASELSVVVIDRCRVVCRGTHGHGSRAQVAES
jgi:two-component system nitrate/nitrite response regulator NarL